MFSATGIFTIDVLKNISLDSVEDFISSTLSAKLSVDFPWVNVSDRKGYELSDVLKKLGAYIF